MKQLNESQIIKYVEDKLSTADKTNLDMQCYANIAYYSGKQWIIADNTNKRVLEAPKEPFRARFTGNRIQPIVRTELAKLIKNRPITQVIPASSDDDDIKASEIGEKVIDWLWYELELQKANRELAMWGLTCGTGFMKPFWNSNKGIELADPETGESLNIKTGDIDYDVISILEVKWDPTARKWDEVKWICHEKVRDVDYVKEVYGKDVKPQVGIIHTNIYESKIQNLNGDNNYKPAENSVVVNEFWEKPSAKYPKGRRITVANNVLLLYEEDIGFGKEDNTERELPFFPFFHILVPGRVAGQSIIELLIPLQREYNKTRSQLIDNKNNMAFPKWLVQEGSLIDEITDESGQVVHYNRAQNKPEIVTPPNIGADAIQNIEQLKEEFDYISGQHETSHGQTPTGVKSGIAIAYLQEQDDTKLGPTVMNFESCIENYSSYMLKMMKIKCDVPRTLKIVGKDKEVSCIQFKGSDLTSTDVRVQAGSSIPQSKTAKQEWVFNLINSRVLDPIKDRNLIVKMLELGITDEMYDDYAFDVNHAQGEQLKWKNGDLNPQVREFFNHEIHIVEHNKFRKSDDYEKLPPEAQMAIDEHVNMHVQLLMPPVQPMIPQNQGVGANTLPL